MSHLEIDSVTPWPPDVDAMFCDPDTPGAVNLIIYGRVYRWPWQQAAAVATDLAVMAGRAACRTDATWQDIATALDGARRG